MRGAIGLVAGVLLAGCGLDLAGTKAVSGGTTDVTDLPDAVAATTSTSDGGAGLNTGLDGSTSGNGSSADAGSADAAPDSGDAASGAAQTDAGPDAAAAPRQNVIYAVSAHYFWTVDPVARTFSTPASLPAPGKNGCPSLHDVAVDDQGHVFATAADKQALYAVDPVLLKCTQIGGTDDFPVAMSFAPAGTLDPSVPVLVGYRSNGDYVRIDVTSGAITVVNAGVRSLTSGDLTNHGTTGYLGYSGGGCMGTCFNAMRFATGGLGLGWSAATVTVAGAAQWGGYVFGFADDGTVWVVDVANQSLTSFSAPSGYGQVSFTGAGSPVNAPTN